jgi:hypothetical protein
LSCMLDLLLFIFYCISEVLAIRLCCSAAWQSVCLRGICRMCGMPLGKLFHAVLAACVW